MIERQDFPHAPLAKKGNRRKEDIFEYRTAIKVDRYYNLKAKGVRRIHSDVPKDLTAIIDQLENEAQMIKPPPEFLEKISEFVTELVKTPKTPNEF